MDGLYDMDLAQLEGLMESMGEKPFRAKQLFSWLYKGIPPAEMGNLPKQLREKLEAYPLHGVQMEQKLVSNDGTTKYLFLLFDGNIIESVYMTYKYGGTLCISTQAGCRMGCAFCASTIGGLKRNLSAGEMAAQCVAVEKDKSALAKDGGRAVTNIVMMGCGEPLDNYDNAIRFLHLISAPGGMGVSPRNISLSTCGLAPQIIRLAKEKLPVTLCISLHAADDETRQKIMPAARAYPIAEILEAVRFYIRETGRRVIFEYAPIKGLNDSEEDAAKLCSILKNLQCHVNLISLNPVEETCLQGSEARRTEAFSGWLSKGGLSVTIRRSLGQDIQGACGQLRRSYIKGNI